MRSPLRHETRARHIVTRRLSTLDVGGTDTTLTVVVVLAHPRERLFQELDLLLLALLALLPLPHDLLGVSDGRGALGVRLVDGVLRPLLLGLAQPLCLGSSRGGDVTRLSATNRTGRSEGAARDGFEMGPSNPMCLSATVDATAYLVRILMFVPTSRSRAACSTASRRCRASASRSAIARAAAASASSRAASDAARAASVAALVAASAAVRSLATSAAAFSSATRTRASACYKRKRSAEK